MSTPQRVQISIRTLGKSRGRERGRERGKGKKKPAANEIVSRRIVVQHQEYDAPPSRFTAVDDHRAPAAVD